MVLSLGCWHALPGGCSIFKIWHQHATLFCSFVFYLSVLFCSVLMFVTWHQHAILGMQYGINYVAAGMHYLVGDNSFPLMRIQYFALTAHTHLYSQHTRRPVVVHGDLRSPNLLLDLTIDSERPRFHVKIADFGLARCVCGLALI